MTIPRITTGQVGADLHSHGAESLSSVNAPQKSLRSNETATAQRHPVKDVFRHVAAVGSRATAAASATATTWVGAEVMRQKGMLTLPGKSAAGPVGNALRNSAQVAVRAGVANMPATLITLPLVGSAMPFAIEAVPAKEAFPDPKRIEGESKPAFKAREKSVRQQRAVFERKQQALNVAKAPSNILSIAGFSLAEFASRMGKLPNVPYRNAVFLGAGAGAAGAFNALAQLSAEVDGQHTFRIVPSKGPGKALSAAFSALQNAHPKRPDGDNPLANALHRLEGAVHIAGNVGNEVADRVVAHAFLVGTLQLAPAISTLGKTADEVARMSERNEAVPRPVRSAKAAGEKAILLGVGGFFKLKPQMERARKADMAAAAATNGQHQTDRPLRLFAGTRDVAKEAFDTARGKGARDIETLLSDSRGELHPGLRNAARGVESAYAIASGPPRIAAQALRDTPHAASAVIGLMLLKVAQRLNGGTRKSGASDNDG